MKKKWQKRLLEIVSKLNFSQKMKEGKMTAEEQKQLFAEYEKTFNISFKDDKTADEDETEEETTEEYVLSEEKQRQIFGLLNDKKEDTPPEDPAPKTKKEAYGAMQKKIVELQQTIKELADTPETEKPLTVPAGQVNEARMMSMMMGHTPHTATHLFGIECDFMKKDKWWNQITATRKAVSLEELSDEDKKSFQSEFNVYTQSLTERSRFLLDTNAFASLDYQKMIEGTAPFVDYTDLDSKFGEYTVRRQDIILAYFRSLPSVAGIFPVQSGVRNKEVVPTVQFGELSQGYREGKIFKGNVKFAAEIYFVKDVMFKYMFSDMIALQKRYVMELSKGSSPFQWTFIEWVIMYFGLQLHNEQQRRRVVGYRVPQQTVTANPAMLAADGVLRAIERAEEELKVLPFDDYKMYTESTILDYFERFWDNIDDILPNMEGLQIYANAKHKKWYLRAYREKYGKDIDFSGVQDRLIDVNPEQILWVPNMPSNYYKVWATYRGNIENLEYVPNEMLGFKFREGFENVTVLSRWMEGSVVQKIGVQYKTRADLKASGRKNQYLFTNFPVTELEAGATTVDGRINNLFLTKDNAATTVLTDIENASEETVYKIICGGLTNKTTISKSGKFANISADWIPAAIGDYIKLYAELEDYDLVLEGQTFKATRATGKFLELERKVTTA
ncbi:hypothetical protein EZS27_004052 [termite gut metagenome]|uniref:Uncharacterized protein n=1 Tax=termite gut metagenome TaxID=433724 RepID=A0A5J4SRJ8_9ZZZZ